MKLSIASLSSVSRPHPRSTATDPRRLKPAPRLSAMDPQPRYAAKMIDLDDDDSPTMMRTVRMGLASAML